MYDEVATGEGPRRSLPIMGRPKPGQTQKLILMEEPGENVLLHWVAERRKHMPHLKHNCPHCQAESPDVPVKAWYIGGQTVEASPSYVIVELTEKCFKSAWAAARMKWAPATELFSEPHDQPIFRGLLVHISRIDREASPRVLRCDQRIKLAAEAVWPFNTRRELAFIWGIAVKPRLYREEGA